MNANDSKKPGLKTSSVLKDIHTTDNEQTPLLQSLESTVPTTGPYTSNLETGDNSNPDEPDRRNVASSSRNSNSLALPPTKRERFFRYSIKAAAVFLVGCVLIVLVSPLVAQRVLDRALVLDIQQTDIQEMDETGFQVGIRSTLELDTANDGFFGLTRLVEAFHPTLTIDPTVLSLGISDLAKVEMAELPMEGQQMRLGSQLELNISAHVRVTNATLMAKFFDDTLKRSTVELAIRGPIWTRLGRLWYMKLHINRFVPMDGLKGIKDAELVSMHLPGNHPQGGIVMSGLARINNPSSVMSLEMGPITFGVYLPLLASPESDWYRIAEMHCSQLRLDAGRSSDVELSGRLLHLDDWTHTSDLDVKGHGPIRLNQDDEIYVDASGSEKQLLLGKLLSRFIQGDNTTIQVRALSKESTLPPWLSQVYKSIVLDMVFPGSPTKDFIRTVGLDQLQFGFTDSPNSALLTGQLSSALQLPPNVTFPIKVLKMKPTVLLHPPGRPNMATLAIPEFLTTTSQQNGSNLEVHVELAGTELQVMKNWLPDFYQFLNSSFGKDWIELGIAGDALAVVETGLGTFELGPIPFDVVTHQRGNQDEKKDKMASVHYITFNLDVVDSTEHSLTVKVTLVLFNPSKISATLGDLSFLWSYGGFEIGMATSPELQLEVGNNTIEAYGMMNPSLHCARRRYDPSCDPEEAVAAAREFISKYISGDNSTSIKVQGYSESTHIPLLRPMMETFAIESSLPSVDQDFLISATMYLLSSSLVLELQNPLDTVITVLYINGTASYKNETLGHILVDFEKDIAAPKPIVIPANDHQNETSGYAKTPRLPVMFDLSSVGYEALRKALGGSLDVDVLCHIKARVGAMVMWVDFIKDGVNANVRKGF
ncbi:hypothetical protein BGZ94_002753 [Podila epigama]|nr:hypothetical protein BGZ94_002753 [Podila epigama]